MANLLRRAMASLSGRDITTVEDYLSMVNQMTFMGNTYGLTGIQQTAGELNVEGIRADFAGYAQQLYGDNSAIFALMAIRQHAFSQIRFQFQQFVRGRPDKMFSTPDLKILEKPWPGGITGDLLGKMITDVDLAGNSYVARIGNELVRLRPDWVDIVLEERKLERARPGGNTQAIGHVGYEKIGYLYWEGGRGMENDPIPLQLHEVAHFCPLTDPTASYRGMSWLTPLLREIASDRNMNVHRERFFRNGATPNMIVRHDPGVTPADAKLFKEFLDREYTGAHNAYKTMHIGGGADVTIVGMDFKQADFKQVQGHGETRLASAAGVPPIVVGFSEGLSSGTYSNYGQALRRFSTLTLHPLWVSAVGSLETIVPAPPGCRLWYDTRDVPFLREDSEDLAKIQQIQAATVSSHISAGFTPESAVAAVMNDDISVLEHTGLVSVQLWTPGAQQTEGDKGIAGSGNKGGDEPNATPPQNQ